VPPLRERKRDGKEDSRQQTERRTLNNQSE